MNTYSTQFNATCPNNGQSIAYNFTLKTSRTIRVESISDAVSSIQSGYHEDIADKLFNSFGGRQTLIADHHSVTITTVRL